MADEIMNYWVLQHEVVINPIGMVRNVKKNDEDLFKSSIIPGYGTAHLFVVEPITHSELIVKGELRGAEWDKDYCAFSNYSYKPIPVKEQKPHESQIKAYISTLDRPSDFTFRFE